VHKLQRVLSLHKQVDTNGVAMNVRSASLSKQLSSLTKEFFSPTEQSDASSTSSGRAGRKSFGLSRSFRAASKKFFSPPRDAAQQQQQPTDEANYPEVAAGGAEALAEAAWAQEDRARQLADAPLSSMAGQRSQSLSTALRPALKSPQADDNDNLAVVSSSSVTPADPAAPTASAMAGRRTVSFGGLLRLASLGRFFPPPSPSAMTSVAVPEETATTEADDAQGHNETEADDAQGHNETEADDTQGYNEALDGDAEKLTIDDATSAPSTVRAW
jgi:hypothetical protein